MTSPLCEVQNGAGPFQATTYGVDVTPGAEVTIRLATSADVWSIRCISADETSDAAATSNALTIDALQKTARLTAPAAGKTLIFESIVERGIGPDGTARKDYRTTFGIYTPINGKRVHAPGETFESHPTHGYSLTLNALIRSDASGEANTTSNVGTGEGQLAKAKSGVNLPFKTLKAGANVAITNNDDDVTIAAASSSSEPGGSNGEIQYNNGGSLAGSALAKINGYGEAELQSAKLKYPQVLESSSAYGPGGNHYVNTEWTDAATSSTSPTTLASYEMADETLVAFDVIVTCARKTNVTKGGRYKRSVVYRRTGGGAPTIVGALESGTDQETTAGDDVTIDVSGNDVRVRVTAADSDPRNWFAEFRVQETDST